jgi:hypothetical protein
MKAGQGYSVTTPPCAPGAPPRKPHDLDQSRRSNCRQRWRMASRRISNIEVAGIATVILSVVAVLAIVLLSAW